LRQCLYMYIAGHNLPIGPQTSSTLVSASSIYYSNSEYFFLRTNTLSECQRKSVKSCFTSTHVSETTMKLIIETLVYFMNRNGFH